MENWNNTFSPLLDHNLDHQFEEQYNNNEINTIDDNFLHQLEQNLYENDLYKDGNGNGNNSTNNTPNNNTNTSYRNTANPSASGTPMNHDLNFMISEEMNIQEVYPPSNIPENTPMLMPKKKDSFASPILPGQNEKSFNNQHFFHKTLTQTFTPLVSPAVTPMEKYQPPTKASFEPLTSPALLANDKRRSTLSIYAPEEPPATASSTKRRTPHGTPIMAMNQHPGAKSIRSNHSFEKLPESNYGNYQNENSQNGDNGDGSKDGDLQLMGFTMGKLQEESKPKRKGRKASVSNSNSSSNSSPNMKAKEGEGKKPTTKKASHKLAEQGRRNRMNMAVHELSNLIPQDYHDEVTIPSKATTVELASKYIRALVRELDSKK